MRQDSIDGVIQFTPRRFGDERGYFAELYNQERYRDLGIDEVFVQDNESLSAQVGTVRGLHFQIGGSGQGKLVRCPKGAILDVAVDIRHGSATFGDHVAVRLDQATGNQLWVPVGFAHGFCTLEADSMISYKVTGYYDPDADRGILWNDPGLGIEWPVEAGDAVLSEKDQNAPTLDGFGDFAGLFT